MARPTVQGLEYFPLDTHNDQKISLFIAEAGIAGYGILITLWRMIYREQGYFIDYSDDLLLILRNDTLANIEVIAGTIDIAVKRELFDPELFEKHKILTSRGIQKRYLIGGRKKKQVNFYNEYTLIDVSSAENVVSSARNPPKRWK
jgi:hypothetical protein